MISFLCGDYYLSVSKYDSENEMIEKLRRKNDSIILKKMEHVLDSYIINGYCEMSGNSIGIGVLSSNPVTPPTVSFDPFGFLYIHNGQIFSVVDLNKKQRFLNIRRCAKCSFSRYSPKLYCWLKKFKSICSLAQETVFALMRLMTFWRIIIL